MRISHYKNELALRTLDFLYPNWGGREFTSRLVFELLFCKKNTSARRVWAGGSVGERYMYVTPIRLDVLLNPNQISCCKGFDFFIPLPFNKYEYKYLEN